MVEQQLQLLQSVLTQKKESVGDSRPELPLAVNEFMMPWNGLAIHLGCIQVLDGLMDGQYVWIDGYVYMDG